MSGTVSVIMGRTKDLTGNKYGLLTVLSFHSKVGINTKWNCRCDCGNECVKYVSGMKTGNTVSCGCVYKTTRKDGGVKNAADLIGKRFGRLIVTERSGSTKHKKAEWLCKCDCGEKSIVQTGALMSGNTESCGCIQKEIMSRTGKDNTMYELTGKRFERLFVIEKSKDRYAAWRCKCDCGKEKVIATSQLVIGKTRSCGCLQKEKARKRWFNPNITDAERMASKNRQRMFPELGAWRMKVYRRDHFTCQICGSKGSYRLVAHHINSWKTNLNERFVVENGVSLCKDHHITFHKKYGYKNTTREQWNEFIASKKEVAA